MAENRLLRRKSHFHKGGFCFGNLIVRGCLVAVYYAVFVAFSKQENYVVFFCQREGLAYSLAAVWNKKQVLALNLALFYCPLGYVFKDFHAVFKAGVFVR